jgi:predicted negative regulator of RcsB-dependent stress response
MKKLFTVLFLISISAWSFAQGLTQPPSGDNQKSKVSQFIGPVEVSIVYSSPDVHGPAGEDRKGHIWGELVHYGYIDQGFGPAKAAPWRAGANENTVITFSHDVKVEGKDLKAGSYGLFLSVAKEGPWTWIFSKNTSSWGSYFYNQSEDALRVDVSPMEGAYTEFLTYGFDDRQRNSAIAFLQWENKKIPFKIEVPNVNDLYVSIMRNELRSSVGFDYRNFSNAAAFCVQHKINLEEALAWSNSAMDTNIGGQEEFFTLQTKAQVLQAMNKNDEADAVMEKAVKRPDATVQSIHQYGRSLLQAGKKEKALEIFKYNALKNPAEKFTPNIGLARGYTAIGDKKNAIKYWELAIKNIPDNQKQNLAFYEGELKKLK